MTLAVIQTDLILRPQYNVYLFQPQYSATINGKRQYWIPYSVGCIWSYATQFIDIKNNFFLADLIFRREKIELLAAKFKKNEPHVCGFSVYAWNEQYSLYVAESIKKSYPNCVIVFGGPQCNAEMSTQYDFIDAVVLAEGEEQFTEILRSVASGSSIKKIYEKVRLQNLEIPSPYLTGVFDQIIKENPTYVWSTTIESNRGCPYSCTFCDWGSLTYSKVRKFNIGRIQEELEWIRTNPVVFITSADANFGIYKERDLEIAKLIRRASDFGSVESVAMTYAKNSYADIFDIAKIIGDIGRGVTVSVQSMNPETLDAIDRKNMKINDIAEMMKLSEKYKVSAYTELILGLPLETKETWKNSLASLLELGQHYQIDIYFCILLRNSDLGSADSRKKYEIDTISVYDYVSFTEIVDDEIELPEIFDIVTSTNTMSYDDLIESYMYGWMITHFHAVGYTQQYAKYCRNVLGVSYRKFYDKLFDIIKSDPVISSHMNVIEACAKEFTSTGKIISLDIKSIHLTTYSFSVMHNIKHRLFFVGKKCFNSFITNNAEDMLWLDSLQTSVIYDSNSPAELTIPYNLETWTKKVSSYKVEIPKSRRTKNLISAPASTVRNSVFYKNILIPKDI
jgi:radical SAM superfamily enzyme YgiQ (UPF0313 family)